MNNHWLLMWGEEFKHMIPLFCYKMLAKPPLQPLCSWWNMSHSFVYFWQIFVWQTICTVRLQLGLINQTSREQILSLTTGNTDKQTPHLKILHCNKTNRTLIITCLTTRLTTRVFDGVIISHFELWELWRWIFGNCQTLCKPNENNHE